jgi:hypothetical protein
MAFRAGTSWLVAVAQRPQKKVSNTVSSAQRDSGEALSTPCGEYMATSPKYQAF